MEERAGKFRFCFSLLHAIYLFETFTDPLVAPTGIGIVEFIPPIIRTCSKYIIKYFVRQWFGNTVTMDWWNDLWLNEGFASFVEYYGIDAAEPTWNIVSVFLFVHTPDCYHVHNVQL